MKLTPSPQQCSLVEAPKEASAWAETLEIQRCREGRAEGAELPAGRAQTDTSPLDMAEPGQGLGSLRKRSHGRKFLGRRRVEKDLKTLIV